MSRIITCPICGKRDAYEFSFGGEDRGPAPDAKGLTPKDWSDYVHNRSNVAGQKKWWYHRDGCGTWFTE